jgi:hypothetical protein
MAMDERRSYIKDLASRSAQHWATEGLPECFVGETWIETRNTCYQLRNGVCYGIRRQKGASGAHPSHFVGMRMIGWLVRGTPREGISHVWKLGAHAVLWRPRTGSTERSAVALTSPSKMFRTVARLATGT